MTIPEGWREVRLGQLLTDAQAVQVGRYISKRDTKGLKTYLRSIEGELVNKEVLPDYLYYALCSEFGLL